MLRGAVVLCYVFWSWSPGSGYKVYYIAVHKVPPCPFSQNWAKMAFAKFMESKKLQIGEYKLLEGHKKRGPGLTLGP